MSIIYVGYTLRTFTKEWLGYMHFCPFHTLITSEIKLKFRSIGRKWDDFVHWTFRETTFHKVRIIGSLCEGML